MTTLESGYADLNWLDSHAAGAADALDDIGVGVRRLVEPVTGAARQVIKRVLDLALASVVVLVSAPLVLLVMLAVRLDSPGPVLFRQLRLGRNHKPFLMFKIRSMHAAADDRVHRDYVASFIKGGATLQAGMYKLCDDPRVTRVGRFIRRYSIDELPQLWNVLRGEMSLVGPRPALAHEVELYDEDVARKRLAVRPGITGPWQVSGRCTLSFAEMIDLDVSYAEGWTTLQDLVILARTPRAALTGRGAA